MHMATKQSIFREHLGVWLAAKGDKRKRGEMVRMVSRAAKVHPKSVPRSFRRVQAQVSTDVERRGRKTCYGKEADAALYDVWEVANRPCGELLHPVIADYVDGFWRAKRWMHGTVATEKICVMSVATLKRKTARFREKYGDSHGRGTTRSSPLKHSIPIFKGPWEALPPGNGQLDTVAHCGDSVAGDFAYTVNYTDAPTYWGCRRAQWNKGEEATKESLIGIKARLPFLWLMAHPDTGSEFINYLNWEWCSENNIALTRSEPGKKNDNMYVEERNGHVVRKYLGWHRFDADRGIIPLMNDYYEVLDRYLNHFQAVRRTLSKERIGSKYKRTFEKKAKTPYERLMEHGAVSHDVKEKIRKEHESLNPLLLKEKLDTLREKIFKYQRRCDHRKNDKK
jgi:hypothetical protein